MQDSERDTDIKNRPLDSGRKQGWDDLREYYWNMYITIGETDDQPSSMHETGHSKLVHWDDPEGWDGGGGGRKVWDRGTYVYL